MAADPPSEPEEREEETPVHDPLDDDMDLAASGDEAAGDDAPAGNEAPEVDAGLKEFDDHMDSSAVYVKVLQFVCACIAKVLESVFTAM